MKTVFDDKFSICSLSMPDTTFEEDLRIIAESGARGIGLAEEKLRQGEEREQLAAFRASGLKATVCLPTNVAVLGVQPSIIFEGPPDPEVRFELMCASLRRLAPFEPDCVAVVTGSDVGYELHDARKIVVQALREAAVLAAELGTRLALEPPRRDLGFDATFVLGLRETVALLDEVDYPNIGICFDVYHHWDEGAGLHERIEECSDRIFGVQMSDWREPPRSFADRVVPGAGTIDLPAIVAALLRGGYDGWFDLELFSDDGRWGTDLPDSLWKWPAEQIATRGLDGMRQAHSLARSAKA